MNVLFLNPPTIPFNLLVTQLANPEAHLSQVVAMPMGILYLAATIEQKRPHDQIKILDLARLIREYGESESRAATTVGDFIEQAIGQHIAPEFEPELIGISILFSTAHKTSLEMARVAKKIWPKAKIVFGGMHATNAVSSILANENADFVCRGEAESIICSMLEKIEAGEDLEGIPGIIGRNKLKAATGTHLESAPLIDDLDLIPLPAWHLIPMEKYIASGRVRRLDQISHDKAATVVTTRGCPFRCTFCSSWTVHGRQMRYRSIENILAELQILTEKYHVNLVVPEDDLFTVKKERIIALCEAVNKKFEGKLEFQFPNGLSVATLDEEVIAALCKLGISVANVAIESGSKYVQQKVIKKNCNLDRAREVTKLFYDRGVITRTYFILGFPGESREMIEETINFAASLKIDWCNFGIAAPLIGTEMFKQLLERGDIDENYNWDSSFFQERTYDTEEISARDIKDLNQLANLRVNFFGNYNIRSGNYKRALALFGDIVDFYPNHLAALYCMVICHTGLGNLVEAEKYRARCIESITNPNVNQMAKLHLRIVPDAFPVEFHELNTGENPLEPPPRLMHYRGFWESTETSS